MTITLTKRRGWFCAAAAMVFALTPFARPQSINVSAHVDVGNRTGRTHSSRISSTNVVIWLVPTRKDQAAPDPGKGKTYTMVQKNKEFTPHLLVVPTGSSVDFPNLDPFFHNVFSLFNGKRFDLGLYEAHTHRAVRFDREGVSYIFCNIHPQMGAVIITLSTPYYGISGADGAVVIHNVPPGSYRMRIWAENVSSDQLRELEHTVEISARATNLGSFHLTAAGDMMNHHTNKFGKDYLPDVANPY